jgi:hypothetical protein
MAPTARPFPTLNPLRAKHTIRKDLSKPLIEENDREQRERTRR